jgi:hypothetical protein
MAAESPRRAPAPELPAELPAVRLPIADRIRGADRYPLALLLIPIVVLAGDRSLEFNVAGYLDSWIYYAFFRNLAGLKRLFPHTYYGSRLSWILPGYLVNQVFPPLFANYFLHLLVWYGAVVGLYVVIKEIAGRRTALLSATIFGFYPYLWKAVGWDYVDGAGIAYYLLTAACLTVAARRSEPSRWLLALAGITVAGAVYCNLVLMFLLPFLAVCWVVLRKARGSSLSLFRLLFWSSMGAGSLTVLLGIVNHGLEGSYLFYLPSVLFMIGSKGAPRPMKDTSWIWSAQWLFAAAMALFVGLFACFRYRHPRDLSGRMFLALYANLVFCAAVLTVLEIRYTPVLEIYYYASYLLAPAFLCLGCYFFKVPGSLNDANFYKLLASSAAILSIVWWDRHNPAWQWLGRFGWGLPLVLIAIGLLISVIWPSNTKSLIAALIAASLLVLGSRAHGSPAFVYGPKQTEDAFLRIVETTTACEQMRRGRPIRFWADRNDKNNQEFASIASAYLYGYALFGLDFPKVDDRNLAAGDPLLVVVSSDPEPATRALHALEAVNICSKWGGEKTISRGGVRYTATFLDVVSSGCKAAH